MTKPDTWQSIGTLTQRIAGRLVAQREAQIFAGDKGAATPRGTRLGDAGGVAAVVQPAGEIAAARAAGLDGQELARRGEDVGGIRRAAGRPRVANDASMGNEIRDAALLPLGEGGRDQAAPQGYLPLFIPGE